jgi:hypothetical protein
MTHIDLVNETVKQVANRFTPEPVLIKRRIEILIEVSQYTIFSDCPSLLSLY